MVTELCCYLALHGDRPVSSDQLIAAVWPDDEREGSAKSLRTYLSLLRRSIGPALFPEAEKGAGYELDEAVTTDWRRFGESVADADAAGRDGDAVMEAAFLGNALGLVRGTPFAAVPTGTFAWAWSELLASEMERAVAGAAARLARIAGTTGDGDSARWALDQGLRAAPFDLELWGLVLDRARQEGSVALVHAVRDCRAVLGEDADRVIGGMDDPGSERGLG